jgi:hypothetical protein
MTRVVTSHLGIPNTKPAPVWQLASRTKCNLLEAIISCWKRLSTESADPPQARVSKTGMHHSALFPLFRSRSRLGRTRLGSPGIFGVPTRSWPCSPAIIQVAQACHARSYRARTRPRSPSTASPGPGAAVRRRARDLVLAGVATGGHSQLAEGGLQRLHIEPVLSVAACSDISQHRRREPPVATRCP